MNCADPIYFVMILWFVKLAIHTGTNFPEVSKFPAAAVSKPGAFACLFEKDSFSQCTGENARMITI
eukprot:SAG31_NODE_41880_length_274_cov_0.588571_1_plen_65_part_01